MSEKELTELERLEQIKARAEEHLRKQQAEARAEARRLRAEMKKAEAEYERVAEVENLKAQVQLLQNQGQWNKYVLEAIGATEEDDTDIWLGVLERLNKQQLRHAYQEDYSQRHPDE